VFELYRRKMAASGKEEWPSVVRRARELIETGQVQLPYRYRAVIVDEAQDMGTQEMRLMRRCCTLPVFPIPRLKGGLVVLGCNWQPCTVSRDWSSGVSSSSVAPPE